MTRASWAFGSETSSIPVTTFTLQVVHLPFPPHTETCGIPASLLASNIVVPLGTLNSFPPG